MVDAACGFDAAAHKPRKDQLTEAAALLLRIADLAVRWRKNPRKYETALSAAAGEWERIGGAR